MRRLAVVMFLGISVFAADPRVAALVKAIVTSVKAGMPGKVAAQLNEGAVRALASEPEMAYRACLAAARYARKTAKKDADGWRQLIGVLVRVGRRAESEDGENKDAIVALAEALVAKGRIADELGDTADPTTWSEAADLFERAFKIEPAGGKWLERAVTILREGAGTGQAALNERADTLDIKAKEAKATTPAGKAAVELADIQRLLLSDKKAAKERLEAHLSWLKLKVDPLKPDKVMATAYNDAVTLALREKSKLRVKAIYMARTYRTRHDWLEFELPLGSRWEFERTGGEFGSIVQVGEEAERVLVILLFYYDHDTEYTDGPRGFGGDNVKGLAALGQKFSEEDLVQVKFRKKLRKGKLNRWITKAQYFELGGTDADGDFLRTRSYYWKPKHVKGKTFWLYMIIFGDDAKFSPEAEFVIKSIRAPKRK